MRQLTLMVRVSPGILLWVCAGCAAVRTAEPRAGLLAAPADELGYVFAIDNEDEDPLVDVLEGEGQDEEEVDLSVLEDILDTGPGGGEAPLKSEGPGPGEKPAAGSKQPPPLGEEPPTRGTASLDERPPPGGTEPADPTKKEPEAGGPSLPPGIDEPDLPDVPDELPGVVASSKLPEVQLPDSGGDAPPVPVPGPPPVTEPPGEETTVAPPPVTPALPPSPAWPRRATTEGRRFAVQLLVAPTDMDTGDLSDFVNDGNGFVFGTSLALFRGRRSFHLDTAFGFSTGDGTPPRFPGGTVSASRLRVSFGARWYLLGLGPLRGYFAGGYAQHTVDYDTFDDRWDIDGAGPYFGMGLSLPIGSRISIEGDFRLYQWAGEDGFGGTGDEESTVTSVGIAAHF